MLILITLSLFLVKFLAIGTIAFFFLDDLQLTEPAGNTLYIITTITTAISIVFFLLGRRIFWLITGLISGCIYITMYNQAPGIAEIHQENNLIEHYFKDTETFANRMNEVWGYIRK